MSRKAENTSISERLRRTAIAEMQRGRQAQLAITIAARKIASEYLDLLGRGVPSHSALELLGFSSEDIGRLQGHVFIVEDVRTSTLAEARLYGIGLPTPANSEAEGAFVPPVLIELVILVPGGPAGAADPACVQAQLPKDRKPTKKEIEEAWRHCVR